MPTKPSSTHRARCTLCRKLLSRRCRRLSRRSELVELWRAFNLHLHHVMSHADEAKLNTPCTLHTLQEIAFKTVPQAEPVTLEYLMKDYVDHLKHHLAQIFGENH